MSVYDPFAQAALEAIVGGATLKAVCLSADYTFSASHEFRSSISAEEIGTAVTLTGVTTTNGVLDANNPLFVSVSAGEDVAAVAIFIDTGVEGTSRLLKYDDTPDLTPDGGNLSYTIHANGLLRL